MIPSRLSKASRAPVAGGLALMALGALTLAGCSPLGVAVGAGAIAGTAAMEERGIEQAVADKTDELGIIKRLADYRFDTFRRVDVAVYEGRALLTGIVPEPEDRIEAVRVTWATDGIVDVVNEVLIGEGIDTLDTSYDIRITTELRGKITLDRGIKAVNYTLEAVGGTVYLFGIKESEAEVERVEAHARTIPNVRRVVDHTLLKDGAERAALLQALEKEKARLEAEAADKGAAQPEAEEAAQ